MCVVIGIQLPFFPLWLEAKGLDAGMIGLVLAAPMVVRLFSIPVLTRLADRQQAVRGTIITASVLAAVATTALGFTRDGIAILLVFTLASIPFTPVMPLAEAYALRGLAQVGRAYGPVRLWGSAAFIAGSLGAGWIIDSIAPGNLRVLQALPGVKAFLGDFTTLGAPVAWLLLKIYAARAVLLLVVLLSLRNRLSLGYYAALLAVFGDALLSLYLLITGYGGWAGSLLNLVIALAIFIRLFGLNSEFAVNHLRIMVKPDPGARSPLDFYQRGQQYRKRGMWAMAVAQWRKAVGLAPQVPGYYKQLGIGYAQIKQFDRSLRALEEANRQAPDDSQIDEIITVVRRQSETQSLLKQR